MRTLAALALAPFAATFAAAQPAVPTSELSGLHGVFGEHVSDLNGDDAGRLWDILIDHDGKPRAAVIDYGGALGVGRRKVAVAWHVLRLVPNDAKTPIRLALTRQQLGALPEFKYGTATTVVGSGQ
jgi:hypothetical protein